MAVAVLVLITSFIGDLIAVVVLTVAPLLVARMNAVRQVVAVRQGIATDHVWTVGQRHLGTVAVTIEIAQFIHLTVAVVVDIVALLDRL